MTVHIHIGRLVLDGFDFTARDREAVENGFRAELTRRLEISGVSGELRSGASLAATPTAEVALPAKPSPAQAGHAIGGAVHGGIGK